MTGIIFDEYRDFAEEAANRADIEREQREEAGYPVEIHTMPAIIAGPMSEETVEVLGRCAPHITVVVTAERADRSHINERPGTVLTPREVVVAINDVSLDYRTPTDLLLLADRLRSGGWTKTADKVHTLAGRAGRNLMHGPGLNVSRALRSIAAPLIEYAS